ncbi:hypothetical protein [Chryseotalea sanaruensis]|nr:hypothetical protein [Chryseotalea sanaruensis]
MTSEEKIRIGVNKIKAISFLIIMLGMVILPPYFVYFTDNHSDNLVLKVVCLPVVIFLGYYMYKLFIKRIFLGSIITLSQDELVVKDEDKVYHYRWLEIKTVKVEGVVAENSNARSTEQTILTIWSTTKKAPDVFNISDLAKSGDEIRSLIDGLR